MSGIEIKTYSSPQKMMAEWEDWLEMRPAVNNLLLGLLYRIGRREAAGGEVDALMVGVWEDGVQKVALLRTPPRELVVALAEEGAEVAMEAAAGWLRENLPDLPGVVGPHAAADAIGRAFPDKELQVGFLQRVMQVDRLVPAEPCVGQMRLSAPGDMELLAKWFQAFFNESLNKPLQSTEAVQLSKAKIMDKGTWVWEVDGEVVSMAGVERPTRNGITVVLVYTPPAHRGHGYASNLVGQISDLQFRQGRKFLCLHTDAANPTSNKIYEALGYYQVGEGGIWQLGLVDS